MHTPLLHAQITSLLQNAIKMFVCHVIYLLRVSEKANIYVSCFSILTDYDMNEAHGKKQRLYFMRQKQIQAKNK